MAISKQCIGIDISKATFTACLCQRSDDGVLTFSKTLDFSNDTKGFNQFLRWVKGVIAPGAALVFSWRLPECIMRTLPTICTRLRKGYMLFSPIRKALFFEPQYQNQDGCH